MTRRGEHDLTELDTERVLVAQVLVAVIETPWVVSGVPGLVILWLAPARLPAALRRRRNDEKVDGETVRASAAIGVAQGNGWKRWLRLLTCSGEG